MPSHTSQRSVVDAIHFAPRREHCGVRRGHLTWRGVEVASGYSGQKALIILAFQGCARAVSFQPLLTTSKLSRAVKPIRIHCPAAVAHPDSVPNGVLVRHQDPGPFPGLPLENVSSREHLRSEQIFLPPYCERSTVKPTMGAEPELVETLDLGHAVI